MVKLGYEVNISNELVDDNHRQGGKVGDYAGAYGKAYVNNIAHPFKSTRARNQTMEDRHQKGEGIISRNFRPYSIAEFNKQSEFIKSNGRKGAITDVKGQMMLAQQQAMQKQAQQQAQQAQISNIRAEQVAHDMPVMAQQDQQIDVLTQSLKDSQEDNQQLQSQLQEVSVQAQSYQQQAQQAANVINTATVLGNMQAQNPDSPVILAAANAADSQQGE